MTDKVYTVLAIDLKFSVEELNFKYDCFLTKIKIPFQWQTYFLKEMDLILAILQAT